jgi:hypothetical protein
VRDALPSLPWVALWVFLWLEAKPLVARVIAVMELRAAPPVPPIGPVVKPMPPDLFLGLSVESEPWAREELLQRANELYAKYGDWDKVRTVLSD